jgi:hypothetical protein
MSVIVTKSEPAPQGSPAGIVSSRSGTRTRPFPRETDFALRLEISCMDLQIKAGGSLAARGLGRPAGRVASRENHRLENEHLAGRHAACRPLSRAIGGHWSPRHGIAQCW